MATKSLKRTHPTVVEDLTPALLSLGEIQRVLHELLDDGVPVRDLVRIYEALSVAAKGGTDPDRLLEAARAALAPAIVAANSDGRAHRRADARSAAAADAARIGATR